MPTVTCKKCGKPWMDWKHAECPQCGTANEVSRTREAPARGRLLFMFEPRTLAKVNFTLDESAALKAFPVAGVLLSEEEGQELKSRNLPGKELGELLVAIAVDLIKQKLPSVQLTGELELFQTPPDSQGRFEIRGRGPVDYSPSEWEALKDETLKPLSTVDWGPNSRRSLKELLESVQ